jgi:hypothetical protein
MQPHTPEGKLSIWPLSRGDIAGKRVKQEGFVPKVFVLFHDSGPVLG